MTLTNYDVEIMNTNSTSNRDNSNAFQEFDSIANGQGVESALDFLEKQFRDEKDFYALFEVLKMKCRHGMGLSLNYQSTPDDITESNRQKLEDRLLEACKTVGELFFTEGRIEEGWMYLQPLGDQKFAESLLRKVELKLDDEESNLNSIIDLALQQGVAPGYGYELLLKHTGTCNGITAFDVQANQFDLTTQVELASLLVNHLYNELLANIRHHVNEQTNKEPQEKSLADFLNGYNWLVHEGGHHIDATHLASTVRIARKLESQEDLAKAVSLADYGTRLAPDFHYASDPPFESTYADHLVYFKGLAQTKNKDDSDAKAAIGHFTEKAQHLETTAGSFLGWEVLVDLLVRMNMRNEAIELAVEKLVGNPELMGISPSVFEIAKSSSQYEKLANVFRERKELLGFAISKLGQITETE